jgi:hypothetical protein
MSQYRDQGKALVSRPRVRATAILGLEGISKNATGELSIEDDAFVFQTGKGPAAQIPIASVQNVSFSQEDKQVGGTPMAMGRAAVPFGGGRVIGLLAHKKYDFLTLEYLDSNGGYHGAICQLNKGQRQVLANELEIKGVHVSGLRADIVERSSVETKTLPALAEANDSAVPQWSVEVKQVDAADLNIEPEFKVAIYENLLEELVKSKQFSAVLRSGDRRAKDVASLLILKITVESYTPGSETKRAVTTVTGATKLKVRTQLCTREGQVVFERVVDGNVRFFGGNLRATHNLACNVANALKQASGLRVGTDRRAAAGAVSPA